MVDTLTKMIIFSVCFSLYLEAAEVDHFSTYTASASLIDSRKQLNLSFNSRMTKILDKLEDGCHEKQLYKAFKKYFTNGFKPQSWLRTDVIFNDKIDLLSYTFKESIYSNFTLIKFLRIMAAPIYFFQPFLARILRIGDVYLGTDKIGHFLGSGFKYFKKYYLKGQSLGQALMIGWKAESNLLGSKTTRVISYADMLANFNGMRFWNHILQKEEDILGQNLGPYINCQENRWVQIKAMDWGDYIDHGFDETINCSRFTKEKNKLKIQKNIKRTLKEQNLHFKSTCPLIGEDTEKILWLKEKYGNLSPYLLNWHGHSSLNDKAQNAFHPAPLLIDLKK